MERGSLLLIVALTIVGALAVGKINQQRRDRIARLATTVPIHAKAEPQADAEPQAKAESQPKASQSKESTLDRPALEAYQNKVNNIDQMVNGGAEPVGSAVGRAPASAN